MTAGKLLLVAVAVFFLFYGISMIRYAYGKEKISALKWGGYAIGGVFVAFVPTTFVIVCFGVDETINAVSFVWHFVLLMGTAS